jgi:hypothetical protein
MFEEMLLYHLILVYILLGVILIGATIPFWNSNYNKTIKRLRIYMFWFHGIMTTVAFSGLVAFVFAKMDFNLRIFTMIMVYISITLLESIKYIKTINRGYSLEKIRNIAIKYTIVDIILIVAMILWKTKGQSGAVSIL